MQQVLEKRAELFSNATYPLFKESWFSSTPTPPNDSKQEVSERDEWKLEAWINVKAVFSFTLIANDTILMFCPSMYGENGACIELHDLWAFKTALWNVLLWCVYDQVEEIAQQVGLGNKGSGGGMPRRRHQCLEITKKWQAQINGKSRLL